MRIFISCALLALIALWLALGANLLGIYHPEWFPEAFKELKRPASTADFGQSYAILDGVLSSLAVVLAMVAILLQGKELRTSSKAQTEQARALTAQLQQQQQANMLGACAARLQFLNAECDRLEAQIDSLVVQAGNEPDPVRKNELWNIIKNSRAKQVDYRQQARGIDEKIEAALARL